MHSPVGQRQVFEVALSIAIPSRQPRDSGEASPGARLTGWIVASLIFAVLPLVFTLLSGPAGHRFEAFDRGDAFIITAALVAPEAAELVCSCIAQRRGGWGAGTLIVLFAIIAI